MRIVIAGGSGFIGKKLTQYLYEKGHDVIVLSRKAETITGAISHIKWLVDEAKPEKLLKSVDVFINLAGVSINAGRWTEKHQKEIYESRMTATDELLRIIAALDEKPSVLINASAIGIFPPSETNIYTENSKEVANDFLSRTVGDWENKAGTVAEYGTRPVFMRFGVVLGNEGGALPLMALPYKLFVGGPVGSGKQWVSWVHVEDVVRAIDFCIENQHIRGPVNVTAPNPVLMDDFGRSIAAVTHRPHWLPVPALVMKLVLGKKSALVLEGQKVIPNVLVNQGFRYQFPNLSCALMDLLK
ncbi:TIGR01777 family oxidoreductase [Bacillus marasmi]|uniref:TIGR01777 family oxidoreductase n=1 Tax=Bacillus marasmi TaxID=1926279 RepID=UPI0011CB3AB4|nr:TIGR01777 family oxidoreductase [Bacillus marasmi]